VIDDCRLRIVDLKTVFLTIGNHQSEIDNSSEGL